MASKSATLKALLNDDNSKNGATVKTDPLAPQTALLDAAAALDDTAPTPPASIPNTGTRVKKGKVKPAAPITLVAGWQIPTAIAGAADISVVKTVALRESKNVWYPLVESLAISGAPCYLPLTRPEGVSAKDLKSPLAGIKAAILACQERSVKGANLMICVPTKDGGWWIIRAATLGQVEEIRRAYRGKA